MRFFRALICALLFALQLSSALAWSHGSAASFASPKSGLVLTDDSMFPFVNFMRMAGSNNSSLTTAYPSSLNATNLPTGTLSSTLNYNIKLPSNYLGKMVIAITGTIPAGGFQFSSLGVTNTSGQVYAASNATLTGCTNSNTPPCFFGNTLSISGTNPVVTLDLSTPITGATSNAGVVHIAFTNTFGTIYANGQAITVSGVVGSDGNGCGANGSFTLTNASSTGADLVGSTFPGGCTYTSGGQIFPFESPALQSPATGNNYTIGFKFNTGTYSGMTGMIMCKLADYNTDNTCNTTAGKPQWTADGFNDDFIQNIAKLNPHHVRYLDVNSSVFRVATDYSHWPTPSTAWSYNLVNDWWVNTLWFGSTSGTNSYAVTCSGSCNYTLTGGAPVDGDYFQFFNVNASTNMSPTLTITDKNSVTSSAIPIFDESADHYTIRIGGTITAGDTIALQFNTTNLTATTCLSGNTHTTSAYTVQSGDTTGGIQSHLVSIVQADATLSPQPLDVTVGNPFNGSQTFFIAYAKNACTLTITPVITGSATETVTVGPVDVGLLRANTLYTGQYNAIMGGIVVNTFYTHSGTGVAWPWQTQINLAKALSSKLGHGVGCWLQIPLYWTITSYQALANYENANQCQGGAIYELGNEIWNPGNLMAGQAGNLANAIGISGDNFQAYQALRSRQLFGAGKTIYGSIGGHFLPTIMYQLGSASSSALQGSGLCGNSCSNPAYQVVIGTDYNTNPNQPAQYSYAIGDAPYYNGSIVNAGSYGSSTAYGSWSATSSSVSGNVLTVSGTVTGTIWWNQGISSCDGVYIAAPTPTNPASSQLTGTVTTTLNGAMTGNQNTGITLTSVAGLSPGMWMFDQTTGFVNGVINTINAGTKQISVNTSTLHNTYASAGTNDTIVFGGLAGTYQLNSTSCSAASGTITGGDVLGFQYAIDNYNQINSALGSQGDGLKWVNQDVLLSVQNSNMYSHNTIQSIIADIGGINSIAVANSQAVLDYEASLQLFPPTTSQATSMGLPSSSYGGITGFAANLIFAFYNSSYAYNLELTRHNLEISSLPAGSMTMYYVYSSNFPWGLFPAGLYSTPYQQFNAIQNYDSH